jgi:hypothetical protein
MPYVGNQPTSVAFLTNTFSGNGSTTAFTMSAAPATTSSILVAISGVLQDPSTYSVIGTTLNFSPAPPTGTGNISVRFLGIPASGVTTTAYRTQTEFTATANQTTFSVPSYTPGFIDVYRNGVLLASTNFVATNGTTVVLNNAASAGDLVETVSFFVSSVINAIPAVAGAVTSSYLLDASVTQAKLASGVAGNGPAFSAFNTGSQALSSAVATKVILQNEDFDTANCFDSTTNYRFTPNVAGYYQLNGIIYVTGTTFANSIIAIIYKNGSTYQGGSFQSTTSPGTNGAGQVSSVVYLNGATDYVELYGYAGITGTGALTNAGVLGLKCQFSGGMLRGA